MGGLGVFAWLAIGAAAGWTISRLMVGAADDALRGTAAGMIGAVLGGLGMRLVDWSPGLVSNNLDTSVAALAGSLWLTWITCVVTSGRRRDSLELPPQVRFAVRDQAPDLDGAHPTLAYAAARDQRVDQLLRDAMAHDGGIAQSERPLLARAVAADLEGDRDFTDARLVARFDVGAHPPLANHGQTRGARKRAG